jgi:S-adenosylmethionine:tRNA ribosyltransferase-isomerase
MSDWSAIGMPLKKIRRGKILNCGRGLTVHHLEDLDEQTVIVRFNADRESVLKWLYEYGKVPLPPYIHRSDEQEPERRTEDLNRYQTIYANSIGSVAAPTAGLHFTAAIMSKLQEFQVNVVDVMLHVGAGTFLPVKSRDVRNHQMHFETYCIPQGSYQAICSAREKMQPIIAVGTTTFRCLESFFDDCTSGMKAPEQFYSTNLFIRPSEAGKRCRPVSGITGLITNFHQPKSTLFMLVCALIGIDSARAAYAYAVEQRYRFLSYGDACYFQL